VIEQPMEERPMREQSRPWWLAAALLSLLVLVLIKNSSNRQS
jgi:hypothetical protein